MSSVDMSEPEPAFGAQSRQRVVRRLLILEAQAARAAAAAAPHSSSARPNSRATSSRLRSTLPEVDHHDND
jgi:hypothetical protein